MEDYLEIYSQWYPKTYRLKDYPREVKIIYNNSHRSKLLAQLSVKQRGLIDRHRRYLVRSLFLSKQFLNETDWEFYDLKTDNAYHIKDRIKKLHCDCGRPLKYQFIVKSRRGKKEIKLGITHFSDHLKISPSIANEIKKGITTVDISLDELLYLKAQHYKFPEDLWMRYCIAHYRNNTLDRPAKLNMKLLKRLIDFRENRMPIFTGDYRATLDEISKVYKNALFEREGTFVNDKSTFETYCSELKNLSNHEVFRHNIFFSENANAFFDKNTKLNELDSESLIDTYVGELCGILNEIETLDYYASKKTFDKFMRSSSSSKFIDSRVTYLIYQQFIKHKWNDNFYISIPKFLRNKMQDNDQKSGKNFKVDIQPVMKEVVVYNTKDVDKNELGKNLEIMNHKTEIATSSRSLSLEDNQVFFEFLYNILFLPKSIPEETILTFLDLLFETFDLDDWLIAYSLVEARNEFIESNNFDKAYQFITRQFYEGIKAIHTKPAK